MNCRDLLTSITNLLLVSFLCAACSAPTPEPAATATPAPEPTDWPTAELLILDKGRRVFPSGLDDVYRISETNRGACKGHWSNDHTFVINVIMVGQSERFEQTMTFEGDEMR